MREEGVGGSSRTLRVYASSEVHTWLQKACDLFFSYRPPHCHFPDEGEEPLNFYELGPQNSRGFRALKVWLALRQAGRQGCRRMLAEDIRLARLLCQRVAAHPRLEAFSHGLSITAFRYVPEGVTAGVRRRTNT